MLIIANTIPATQPMSGIAAGAIPPEDLEDAEEEAVERIAVESPVEDAEVTTPDELGDPLPVKEAVEVDPELDGAELALTMLFIDPLVAELPAEIDVVRAFELATGIGVATEVELETETDTVIAIETE